jgi:epoxyqueuosine reductase QueG
MHSVIDIPLLYIYIYIYIYSSYTSFKQCRRLITIDFKLIKQKELKFLLSTNVSVCDLASLPKPWIKFLKKLAYSKKF